ncbi:hypothetical protein PHSC3_000123 [Chlamydiales bacterium STE3]|nr:hypothetical protein PHSC3_000123 [Chlamydiales bacterium STE3]
MSVETSLMIIALSSVLVALCATVLLFFVIRTIIRVDRVTDNLSEQAEKAIKNGMEINEKIKEKIDATTPLFHSLAKMGSTINHFSEKSHAEVKDNTVLKVISLSPTSKKEQSPPIVDLLDFIGLAILLWQKFKKGAKDE